MPSNFPPDIIKAAQDAHKATGCPASLTLAQWALESGYGKFLSAPFNYFGIKWVKGSRYGYQEKMTKECYSGKWVTVPARFVSYPSLVEAFNHHGRLLTRPDGPYRKALPLIKDARKFLLAIAPIYATDPKYAEKLLKIIQDNKLEQYDLPPSS